MIDYKTGEPHTAHTTNPVPLVLYGMENVKLKSGRLLEELKDIQDNPLSDLNISVGLPDENNIHKWRVTLKAPQDSNYNGGLFLAEIYFQRNILIDHQKYIL